MVFGLRASAEVEISAVSVPQGEPPCMGFTIRDVGRRLGSDVLLAKDLPRSADQMTELVGRVPLRDIVRETTDLIEQLCINAALQRAATEAAAPRAARREGLALSRRYRLSACAPERAPVPPADRIRRDCARPSSRHRALGRRA